MNELYNKLKFVRKQLAYDIGELDYEGEADTIARHLLTVVDLLIDEYKVETADFTGVSIQKYESSSGNITWKVQDENDNPVWLRQAHKDMLEAAGVWEQLNALEMDEWYDDCEIMLQTVPDGDFKKPVKVIEFRVPTLPRKIEYKPSGFQAWKNTEPSEDDVSSAPIQPTNNSGYYDGYSDSFKKFAELIEYGNYIVLDTETATYHQIDGKSFGEICEISIIDDKGNVLLDTLVKPSQPITKGATAVHGITDEMVAESPLWIDVAKVVADIITGKNVIIYNRPFDMECLIHTDDKSNASFVYGWWELPSSIHCAMEAYAEFNGDWNDYHGNYRWVKLTEAARKQGIPQTNAHRALGDCIMTNEVIKSMLTIKQS